MKFTHFSMLIVSSFFITNLVAQCFKDSDCPGNLICNGQGECVNPSGNQETASTAEVSKTPSSSNNNNIGIYIIPKFGINIAKLYGDFVDGDSYHSKSGVLLGTGLSLAFNNYFTFEPELNFSMRGSIYRELDYNNFESYEENFRMYYLELPLKAKLTIPTGTAFTPSVFFAPVVSFRVAAKLEEKVDDGSHIVNFNDVTHPAEFGLAFGGGGSIAVRNLMLSFETRFLFGLTDVFNYIDNCKTWVISFTIGAGFKVK